MIFYPSVKLSLNLQRNKPRNGAKDKTAKFYSVFIFNTVSLNQYFKLLLFKYGLMSFLQAVTS